MATDNKWRTKLDVDRAADREKIDGFLATTGATVGIAVIAAGALIWAIVSTFLP